METTHLLFKPAPSKPYYLLPIEELSTRANENDVNAQLMLGLYYFKGMSNTIINYDLGRYWIDKAAHTDPESSAGLCAKGLCCKWCIGDIQIKDLKEAKEFIEQAAERDYIPAKLELAEILRNEELANKHQGAIYQQATPGRGANLRKHTEIQSINEIRRNKILDLVTSCAKANYSPALNELGYCYSNGFGVAKNHYEGYKYIQMAAELGLASAKRNMGIYFEYGHIGPKDETTARKWYRAALDQNWEEAHNDLLRLGNPCCRIL